MKMISLKDFLPQGESIAALIRQIREGTLPHALMISGEEGTGKWTLALAIAASLLCESPDAGMEPCGRCKSCEQIKQLAHPDFTVLKKGEPLVPTTTKTVIPVSDVQEMIRRIGRKGYQSDRHIVIIRHAEDLDAQAQNNMLKTLEDPPTDVYFFLTCIHVEKVLPTVISRCRPLVLHPWKIREVLSVLQQEGITGSIAESAALEADGSFGKAVKIAGDSHYWEFRNEVIQDFLQRRERSEIPQISSKWKDRKDEADAALSVVESFFSRIVRLKLGVPNLQKDSSDIPQAWQDFARKADLSLVIRMQDAVANARKQIYFSINIQAVVEQLILTFLEALDLCSI